MFSDYAYLDSAVTLTFALPFIIHRVYTVDKTKAISLASLKRVELKTVAIFLLLLSLVIMIVYDWIATIIKYQQGYWVDPASGAILMRPIDKYTNPDKNLFPTVSILMNLSLTLKCTALFLVMALWNHMSKAVLNKQFMSSREFKAYAVYSIISLASYPFLQIWYYMSNDYIVSSVLPLFLQVFQSFLLVILSQVANRRFKKIIANLPPRASAIGRLEYYLSMNNYLAFALICEVFGLGAISIDAVSTNIFYFNKFLLDFTAKLFTFGFALSYIITIFILCPSINLTRSSSAAVLSAPQSPSSLKMRASQNLPALERGSRRTLKPLDLEKTHVLHRDTRGYFKIKVDRPPSSLPPSPPESVAGEPLSPLHDVSTISLSAESTASIKSTETTETDDTYIDEIAINYAD